MKRPAVNVPGIPFNFDWIPLAIEPDLWDLDVVVPWRRTKFVVYYAFSMAVFGGIVGLVGYIGVCIKTGFRTTTDWVVPLFFFGGGCVFGIFSGLAVLYDFNKYKRQYEQEKQQSTKVNESS